MADVFISYAVEDRAFATKLSALLESHGFSTWWDSSLEAGEEFRTEIMKELDEARAVIVIWTEHSVKSDWVRAEAARARSQDKLIPSKTSTIRDSSIPLPFGELHTEDFQDDLALLQAVRRTLEKPQTESTTAKQLAAAFRHEWLSWLGIAGGVLTLSANLEHIFEISKIARWIFEYWISILRVFWSALLFFKVEVSPSDAVFLTFVTLIALSIVQTSSIGSRAQEPFNSSGAQIIQQLRMLILPLLVLAIILVAGLTSAYFDRLEKINQIYIQEIDAVIADAAECQDYMGTYAEPYTDAFPNPIIHPAVFCLESYVEGFRDSLREAEKEVTGSDLSWLRRDRDTTVISLDLVRDSVLFVIFVLLCGYYFYLGISRVSVRIVQRFQLFTWRAFEPSRKKISIRFQKLLVILVVAFFIFAILLILALLGAFIFVVMYFPALLMPVFLPLIVYWEVAKRFPIRLDVFALRRRLWRIVQGVFLIILINYVAIGVEELLITHDLRNAIEKL